MPKQSIPINFEGGLDKKTDPYQISANKFSSVVNSVFTTGKRLTKRNGFGYLPSLPSPASYATTFDGDLTAIGSQIQAYSSESQNWSQLGSFTPCNLSILPVIRNTLNQSQADSAIAQNGLLCIAYTDQNPASLSTKQFRYAIYDSTTGQQLLAPHTISDADVAGPYGFPRVFILGNYFLIVYTAKVGGTNKLQAIPVNQITYAIGSTVVISTSISPSSTIAFDGIVYNNSLYLAWNGSSSSGIKMAVLSPTLTLSATHVVDASHQGTLFSLCADVPNSSIWVSYYNSGTSTGYSLAITGSFGIILAPTETVSSGAILNLASVASGNVLTLYYEVSNAYSYDSNVPSNYIEANTVTSSGTLGTASTLVRSVGLASKAFYSGTTPYFLSAYESTAVTGYSGSYSYASGYQNTYFLINGTTGAVVAELAYENGGGYLVNGLPSVTVSGAIASVAYLDKDFIEALSNANDSGTLVTGGIYSQTGINQVTFTLGGDATITTAEIGNNLNVSGGFLGGYDGTQITEQGFFLWPDSIEATWSASGGSVHAKPDGSTNTNGYSYQVIYEWGDNKGNIFRSAPSIPVFVTTSGSGTSGSITLTGPYLRLTYKINAKVCIYRWSVEDQVYYQVTSIEMPLLNSTTSDSWSYTDTQADVSIIGNDIIYTSGGVVEDIGGPSFKSIFIFDDRLWGITSEDTNLLWFSKQVIEGTPVELSDLLTQYVAPSISALGPTGPLACGAPMDDKLILFKAMSGIYYINGTGPDNTGANSQYSQPTFVTSMIGCDNQASIVFQPQGLMFEFSSEAGNQIWLLGRDLSTQYIGAAVEAYTLNTSVTSAVAIPGTNQVRFTFSNGTTVMYDYYYGEWGQFTVNAVASTLYQGLHTIINPDGLVFQETPGLYLDGSTPVVISFTTAWFNLAGLQGYQRAHYFYLLGTYYSPHKLNCQIAYDYNPIPQQNSLITPTNFAPTYGGSDKDGQDPVYGQDSPYGGPGAVEQWRVFLDKQRCQAFQLTIQEVYDPIFGVPAGQGLSLSGLNLIVALKKGWRPMPAANSIGSENR